MKSSIRRRKTDTEGRTPDPPNLLNLFFCHLEAMSEHMRASQTYNSRHDDPSFINNGRFTSDMPHERNNLLTPNPLQWQSANIYLLRSRWTYQFGHRQEPGWRRRATCSGLLRGNVNDGNDGDPPQRTPKYSVYVEPNKQLENDRGDKIIITTYTCMMIPFTTCQPSNEGIGCVFERTYHKYGFALRYYSQDTCQS